MPNRIIKESICTSDSLDGLTWFEEVLFYRLIVNCDDYGCFDGRTAVIKNRLFPLKESLTTKTVSDGINKLASAGLVCLYEHDGKPYLYLPTWKDHQNVRAKKRKYPDPESGCKQVNTSEIICNQMYANVPVIQSNTISESYSYSEDKKRFTPPTLDEVQAYCLERKNSVDPQRFVDYYSSNGWKVGKNAMKDWKAAVRTWERSGYDSPKKQEKRPYGANNGPRDDSKAMEQIRRLREKMNSA